MHKASLRLLFRQLAVRRLAMVAAIGATSAWTACSAAEQGSIGPTSKASVRITVEVAPRFAVRDQQAPAAANSIEVRAQANNRICFDSNSAIPFTVSEERAGGAATEPVADQTFAFEASARSACVALGQEAANEPHTAAPSEPSEGAAAPRTVTLLVSPL